MSPEDVAKRVREAIPEGGLFAGQSWRIAPEPFVIPQSLRKPLEGMGRVLLKYYQSLDLLYRQSLDGKAPEFVARWLDLGKPRRIVDWQSASGFRNQLPAVIRPDVLLTDEGFAITELDSVPGGIGLTAWLNATYAKLGFEVIGGERGMVEGFQGIFGGASKVGIAVSDEAESYRPEMRWLTRQLEAFTGRFDVYNAAEPPPDDLDAVYRFFELFDLENLPGAVDVLERASAGSLRVTAPPKAYLEEKMMFAALWNRRLRSFWIQQLGSGFYNRMRQWVPYTWAVDPAPMPPHAAIPELNLGDWNELKEMSQKDRRLILKVSGFSEEAWGARGVYLGSDMPSEDWATAVDRALASFETNPYVLQRFHKPNSWDTRWYDFENEAIRPMRARIRLCPYFFVHGEREKARTSLGGVLATLCPDDKKIIHGMSDAALAPCVFE